MGRWTARPATCDATPSEKRRDGGRDGEHVLAQASIPTVVSARAKGGGVGNFLDTASLLLPPSRPAAREVDRETRHL